MGDITVFYFYSYFIFIFDIKDEVFKLLNFAGGHSDIDIVLSLGI